MSYPNIVSAIDTQLARLRQVRELLTPPVTAAEPINLDEMLMKLTLEKRATSPAIEAAPSAQRGRVLTMTRSTATAADPGHDSMLAVMDAPETHPEPLTDRQTTRRGSRRAIPVVTGALGGTRPAGPVFVPAAAVAAARPARPVAARPYAAKPAPAVAKPREGTLDSLLRDYARGQRDAAKDPQRAYDLQSFGM